MNRRVVLARRPEGLPKESDFKVESVALGKPEPGQVLIEVSHLSIDAFIRTTLDGDGIHGTIAVGT
ncbi:MAG: NADP-dependent oxidoreductase, partial [Gammaproteobacteria bacterium]|nr:NADP-dependent oxidoreductase [Gammaproteobacteria bacterium]